MNGNDPKTGYFAKGNTLWKEGLKVKKERQQKIDEWFLITQLGGQSRYVELLNDLANGKQISKEEREFMDRCEKLWPYVKTKNSSVQLSGDSESPLVFGQVKIIEANGVNAKTDKETD